MIRVSSLVEQFESTARLQATLLKCRRENKPFRMVYKEDEGEKRAEYPFGRGLIEFTKSRGLIYFHQEECKIQKKQGRSYLPRNLYAICNINLSLL